MATKPDLGIKNPYALDQKQFDAAVALLTAAEAAGRRVLGRRTPTRRRRSRTARRWSARPGRSSSTWPRPTRRRSTSVLPKEGATGWADTWMIDAKSPHPNCAYKWMNWITKPDVQAQVAEWFGEAPANVKACAADHRQDALRHLPRATTRRTSRRSGSGRRRRATAWTGAPTSSACPTPSGRKAWSSLKNG